MRKQPDPWERFLLTGSIEDFLEARREEESLKEDAVLSTTKPPLSPK